MAIQLFHWRTVTQYQLLAGDTSPDQHTQHATYRNTMKLPFQRDTMAQKLNRYMCNSSSTTKELALLLKGYKTDIKNWHNKLHVCDRFNTYEDAQTLVRITHLCLLALRRKGKPTGVQHGRAFSFRKQNILLGTEKQQSSTTTLKNASMESSDILRVSSTLLASMHSFIFKISH